MTERKVASKTFGRYIILHTIGKGEFGKVKLAYDPQKDIEVAIKFIKRSNITSPQKQAKLEREINILQNLDHPNIVRLYDVIETEKYIGIVMAYANGGELFEYISENQYLSEEESAKFFIQLLDGVQYLHSRHIVHRDLKLENLLLDQKGDIIITDFGFANNSRKNPSGLLSTSCGSPCYAAPELVINDNYIGEAADIWSCGIILYAMLCGYLPFDDDPNNPDGENLDLLYKYILESQLTFPDYVSEDAQELVCGMLIPDPEKRWPMEKVISHRWLRNSMYSKERMNESSMDYMYDSSYLKYLNESTNSEIENQQDDKDSDYPPAIPIETVHSRQIGLDDETEHTEVFEIRSNGQLVEKVDTSMDKTEYTPSQNADKDAVVPDEESKESETKENDEAVVPEIETKPSVNEATTNEQGLLDTKEESPMEVAKDKNESMEVEELQDSHDDKMELDKSSSRASSPSLEEKNHIEMERENAEKQIEKLISEIQQEEFTQLEVMKDQLQEVIAENAEESKEVVAVQEVSMEKKEAKEETVVPETSMEKVEEEKQEVVVDAAPEATTEKMEEVIEEEVKEEEVATVPEVVEEKIEEVKEEEEEEEVAAVPEVVDEKVEEVKEEEEEVAAVPETVTKKVEEVKEEVATVPETVIEKVIKEVKEDVASVPDTIVEKADEAKEEITPVSEISTEKVDEVKKDEEIETPTTLKLEKEDLIEVDEVKSQSSESSPDTSSSISISDSEKSEEKKIEEDKKEENKEEEKKEVEETKAEEEKKEEEKVVEVVEDVEMKENDNSKESEITTFEEDEMSMLKKKRKQRRPRKMVSRRRKEGRRKGCRSC